jgi:hypothetical protein
MARPSHPPPAADALDILVPGLLDNHEACPQFWGQGLNRGWHDIRHDPRPLAAPEGEEPKRLGGWRVGDICGIEHGRPDRIAGVMRLGGQRLFPGERAGETSCNRAHKRREQPVGAAHDAVLLVNDRRNAPQRCRRQGRNRGVAAESDHRRRPQSAKQAESNRGAPPERR